MKSVCCPLSTLGILPPHPKDCPLGTHTLPSAYLLLVFPFAPSYVRQCVYICVQLCVSMNVRKEIPRG
jgi:hypothetical protein